MSKKSKKIKRLRGLCGALYQVLGAHGASVEVLDVVSAAAYGTYKGDGIELLPYHVPVDSWQTVHPDPNPPQVVIE